MSNSWQVLASTLGLKPHDRFKKTAIVCAPSIDSLKQFESRFLANQCNFANTTTDVLGFTSAYFKLDGGENTRDATIELDAYSISFPVTSSALEYLRVFVDWSEHVEGNLSWFFLLDWSMSNQRFWLRDLVSSIELLCNNGAYMPPGSVTVCCVNTEHIYSWQKNTTQWLPQHVELIQQTLRSFCLLKKCSLLYCSSSSASAERSDFNKEAAINILMNRLDLISADLVSTSELRAPHGSDSVRLIKTVSQDFEPLQVFTDAFREKLEAFIPNVNSTLSPKGESLEQQEPRKPYKIDVQFELSKIYQEVQKSKDFNHP